jgi:hypothetical protein
MAIVNPSPTFSNNAAAMSQRVNDAGNPSKYLVIDIFVLRILSSFQCAEPGGVVAAGLIFLCCVRILPAAHQRVHSDAKVFGQLLNLRNSKR